MGRNGVLHTHEQSWEPPNPIAVECCTIELKIEL